ncbi:MAG: periplasmic heavy metal sensor [Desulfobacteraceae bacterium]
MFHRLKGMLIVVPAVVWVFVPMDSLGARMPLGKWWHMPRVAEQLNLNGREKEQLDELFTKTRRKMIELRSAVERERLELSILMDKETMDEDAVKGQFKRLGQARASLAAERFRFILAVRKILGATRFQSLKMLFWESREKRLHRQSRFKRP